MGFYGQIDNKDSENRGPEVLVSILTALGPKNPKNGQNLKNNFFVSSKLV